MALIAENQAEAIETSRNSEANLLKKVHELFMAESQAAIQSTLEQKNESLMTELRELNEKFASEKEKYSVHSTRLELQLKQTQEHVEKLQMLQCDMELQIATMNDEESELTKRAAMLEAHLKDATTKLQHDKALLIALQQESVFEKKSLSMEAEQLTATNHQLEAQLDETKQSNAALDETIASYEKKIEQLEREVIPNLEAALETERDSVARMEAELENRFTELEDSKAAISALEQHVAELQKRNEEEHQRFQMLNEGSNKAFEKMTLAADEKDRQIAVLQQELEQSQQSMDVEHQRMIETNENLQQAKDKLISEQMQLNDALEESMLQLDHIETERKELEKKLAKALDLLEQAKNAVESKDSKTFLIVEGLKGQIADERKRREDAELIRNEAEILAREKDQKIKGLEKSLKQTLEERDMARNNMNGFNEREQELYLMLRESDRIRREMHSRIMQLMGNIRVFVRVRPPLPGEIDKEHRLIAAKSSEDCKKRKRAEDNDDEVMTFRFPGVYDRGGEQKRHVSSSGDDLTKNLIEVQEPYKDRGGLKDRRKKWRFGFDSVFPPTQGQDEVWEATEPLIQCAVDGYNVTIFAYGQTGSGVREKYRQFM